MSNTVKILRGQTLLLHRDGTVLLRKKHVTDASVTTPWGYFVGTDEEVDLKVASLYLKEIVRPTELKVEKPKLPEVQQKKQNFSTKLLNFFKSIFSK